MRLPLVLLLALSARAVAVTEPGIAERIGVDAGTWLEQAAAAERVAELAPLAELIVARLVAGGSLYVAGDPGFCDECTFRAGGFAAVKRWQEDHRLKPEDVVLLGLLTANDAGMRCPLLAWAVGDPGRFHGAAVIAIGGATPLLDRVTEAAHGNVIGADWHRLDTRAQPGTATADAARAQLATVATTMALIGETFAAASRSGRTLAILASIFAPGAEAFDAKIQDQPWLADTPIAPIAAGTVAGAYLATCRTQVERTFAGDQPARIRAAATRIAGCQARGGAVLLVTGGHLFFRGQRIPAALPAVMPYGRAWEWKAPGALRPGDTLLHLGYIAYPAEEVAATLAAGADAIVISVDAGADDERVTALRAGWEAWDAAMPIDGYPYRILPSSGVVLTPLIAAVLGEAEAIVAR